ncbi:MAG: DUF4393 domain-containing protein [Ruminococcaceae bacterium]|nr:DUF4393 domain-containing protein [Oscillospiraceae bacterium]
MSDKLGISATVELVKETKTVQEVDNTASLLVRTIHAALSPLEKWVMQREYNLQETKKILEFKLQNVPIENIITPPSYIAVPALHAISYCMDNEELREMYAELLKTAMNSETVNNVHPTYVEIIKQMSPFESLVFKEIVTKLVQPCVGFSYKNKKSRAAYPIQDIVAFYDIEKYPIVPTQIALENLERLRLIEINRNSKYADDHEYQKIIKCMENRIKQFVNDNSNHLDPSEYEVVYNEHVISVRGFGQFFARACLGIDFSNYK